MEAVRVQGVVLAALAAIIVLTFVETVPVDAKSQHYTHQHSHQKGVKHQKKIPVTPTSTSSGLSSNFYSSSCPGAELKIFGLIKSLVEQDITLPAAWLRLHFHDCFVRGCDASVMINDTNPDTEINAFPNINSLRGLTQLNTVKSAIEQMCPGVVSCADLIALAARDSIFVLSGEFWQVPLGRKDGNVSLASEANADLPSPFSTFNTILAQFQAVGLTAKDMVVLSGAHTIGFTHCAIISSRLYNFPGSPNGVDPTLNPAYAAQLQQTCPESATTSITIPLDPTLGGQSFDSGYYTNVLQQKGLFTSDATLTSNALGLAFVKEESFSPTVPFFQNFGLAMTKMGQINVLTGSQGNVRLNCSIFNS